MLRKAKESMSTRCTRRGRRKGIDPGPARHGDLPQTLAKGVGRGMRRSERGTESCKGNILSEGRLIIRKKSMRRYDANRGLSRIMPQRAAETGRLQGRYKSSAAYVPAAKFLCNRSASVRETISTSFFGAPLKRSQSSVRQARPQSFPQPTSPPVREKMERAPSTTRGTRPAARPSSIFGSIFGHSTPAKPAAPARPRKPERQ